MFWPNTVISILPYDLSLCRFVFCLIGWLFITYQSICAKKLVPHQFPLITQTHSEMNGYHLHSLMSLSSFLMWLTYPVSFLPGRTKSPRSWQILLMNKPFKCCQSLSSWSHFKVAAWIRFPWEGSKGNAVPSPPPHWLPWDTAVFSSHSFNYLSANQ